MKEIIGFENYSIDEYGNVFNSQGKKRLIQTRHNGYLCVILYSNGKQKNKLLHRIVAEAYLPNPQNLPEVNHKDGIKTNCHYNNLEWCTKQYNNLHAHRTGLRISVGSPGIKNSHNILTEQQVRDIRAKYKPYNYKELAQEYNVSYACISHIVNRHTWQHI